MMIIIIKEKKVKSALKFIPKNILLDVSPKVFMILIVFFIKMSNGIYKFIKKIAQEKKRENRLQWSKKQKSY